MWVNNLTKEQFDHIAKTMRDNGRGYEWHTGDYTSIKLTMEDWKKYFPEYLPKKKEYSLLKYHMDCNPDYLFGHAEVAGMLANGDERVSTYEGYKKQCGRRGITCYNEECYNQFMQDCERPILETTK